MDEPRVYGGKPSMEKPDILLVTVPRRNPHIFFAAQLPEALARLKASVEQQGFTSYCMDFDNDFFRDCLFNPDVSNEMEDYFREILCRDYHGRKDDILHGKALSLYNDFLRRSVDRILAVNPRWLGVSMFSEQSIRGAMDLLDELHSRGQTDMKIVVGGLCMELYVNHHRGENNEIVENTGAISSTSLKVGQYIVEKQLAHYWVFSEGERALPELMKGNVNFPGINSYTAQQIDNLSALPIPDYTDFDFRRYIFPFPDQDNQILLPRITVTGSRGCVRHCTFCNVGYFWNRYRWVEPEQLFQEIVHYRKRYGVHQFNWTDSLVNASPPKFKKFLQLMATYRTTDPYLAHNGQFIVREESTFDEEMYRLMNAAGFDRLSIGIESASEKVRADMKKHVSDQAVIFTMAMCRKYNIQAECLMMVGYPTEGREEFQATVDFVLAHAPEWEGDRRVVYVLSAFSMEYDWDQAPINRNPSMHDVIFDPIIGWKNDVGSYYHGLKRRQGLYGLLKELGLANFADFEVEAIKSICYLEDQLRNVGRENEIMKDIIVHRDGTVEGFV